MAYIEYDVLKNSLVVCVYVCVCVCHAFCILEYLENVYR